MTTVGSMERQTDGAGATNDLLQTKQWPIQRRRIRECASRLDFLEPFSTPITIRDRVSGVFMGRKMNKTVQVRPLHLHTVDTLCADLVSGRAVGVGTVVDRDSVVTTGRPQIGMTGSGEFVAIWPTEARGVWGTHRDAGAPRPGSPFLVEAPFFSMGTNAVEGVHPRGDGRFLLVWFGGPASTPLQLRNYSGSAGLGERLIFPYQIGTGTKDTTLIATPFGVSAAWSFFPDIGFGEFDAMQAFLP